MSHIVTIQTEVRCRESVTAACRRLELPTPTEGTHRLFAGKATGLAIKLPKWRYPVVCELPTGTLRYDHYEGSWGDPRQLDRFLQGYAVELGAVGVTAEVPSAAADPVSAVRLLDQAPQDAGATLLVLPNFHRYMNSIEVVQAVARQVEEGRRRASFVVVIAPLVQLPPELERLFVVIEHALPGREQLAEIARGTATTISLKSCAGRELRCDRPGWPIGSIG